MCHYFSELFCLTFSVLFLNILFLVKSCKSIIELFYSVNTYFYNASYINKKVLP